MGQQKTWWVDPVDGDDGNLGSKSMPFLTITAAIAAASIYDKILAAPGSYDEHVVIDKEGVSLIGLAEKIGTGVDYQSGCCLANGRSLHLNARSAACENFSLFGQTYYVEGNAGLGYDSVRMDKPQTVLRNCGVYNYGDGVGHSANGGAAVRFTAGAGDYCFDMLVEECLIEGAPGTAEGVMLIDVDNRAIYGLALRRNKFMLTAGNKPLLAASAASSDPGRAAQLDIESNVFQHRDSEPTTIIDLSVLNGGNPGGIGILRNNYFTSANLTTTSVKLPASNLMRFIGNWDGTGIAVL